MEPGQPTGRLLALLLLTGAGRAGCEDACTPNPLACGGSRGTCHRMRDVDICECSGTSRERHFGPRCERTIAIDAPCPMDCSGRGACVHGWCECDAGWSGERCDKPSWGEDDASPFLTRRALLEAVREDGTCIVAESAATDAKGGQLRACCEPGPLYRRAVYGREDPGEMAQLLDSLPPALQPAEGWPLRPRHRTCAVVASAASLLESEHGAEIDKHDAVFRMNRAPTSGFEKHVGTRTSYDWLNSGPHTTSVHAEKILPRVPAPPGSAQLSTTLLHGTTTAPVEQGSYKRYLEWVRGHLNYASFHPHKAAVRTRLVSLDFLHASWDSFAAYAAPFIPGNVMRSVRPSSGWHTTRLALQLCERVSLYGFSLESRVGSRKFHYYDSLVQATISDAMKDPLSPGTHRFKLEHLIYANWTQAGPLKERIRLVV